MYKLSVIIPTYNKAPRLDLCLASIELQTFNKNEFEVIIVDDGSVDETGEIVNSYSDKLPIRYIYQSNHGRSIARNNGIEQASGEIVVFSDDDVIWDSRFLEVHYEKQGAGSVVHGEIRTLPLLYFFLDPQKNILFPSFKDRSALKRTSSPVLSKEHIYNDFQKKIVRKSTCDSLEKVIQRILLDKVYPLSWLACTGANFSLPLKWLHDVGGFNPTLGQKWGWEDFELGYKLFQRGYPFSLSKEACNYHMAHYRKDSKKELQESFEIFYSLHKDCLIEYVYNFFCDSITADELLEQAHKLREE